MDSELRPNSSPARYISEQNSAREGSFAVPPRLPEPFETVLIPGRSPKKTPSTRTRRKQYTYCLLAILTAVWFGYGVLLGALFYKDSQNRKVIIERLDQIRHDYVEPQGYPMDGMYIVLVSAILDALLFTTYVFGCFCHTQGSYKLYTQLAFLDFVFVLTGCLILFLTQYKVRIQLDSVYKVILDVQYGMGYSEEGDYFIDTVQRNGRCCGYVNYTDWIISLSWQEGGNHFIPSSCCPVPIDLQDNVMGCALSTIYPRGCKEQVYNVGARWRTITERSGLIKLPLLLCAMVLCSYLYRECCLSKSKVGGLARHVSYRRAPCINTRVASLFPRGSGDYCGTSYSIAFSDTC